MPVRGTGYRTELFGACRARAEAFVAANLARLQELGFTGDDLHDLKNSIFWAKKGVETRVDREQGCVVFSWKRAEDTARLRSWPEGKCLATRGSCDGKV